MSQKNGGGGETRLQLGRHESGEAVLLGPGPSHPDPTEGLTQIKDLPHNISVEQNPVIAIRERELGLDKAEIRVDHLELGVVLALRLRQSGPAWVWVSR